MKVISKIGIVLAVGVFMSAGLSNVFAICGVGGVTFTSNYYDAPVAQDPAQTVGNFWGIGQFNPASPGGSDNGNSPSSTWVRYTAGQGFYIAGDWGGDPLYDGCIQDAPNPQPAKMAAAWTTSDGVSTYFVGICTTEDASGTWNTFLADVPGAAMVPVPKPRVNASSRTGTTTNLTVGHQPLAGGVLNGGGCALAVTGFKVYQQSVPRNAPAPSSPVSRRPSSGWTLLGQGATGADVSGQVTCGVDSDIYLMTTVILDGNVELLQGSSNSTRVECGPNLATPTDEGNDFRFIRKPKSAKGR